MPDIKVAARNLNIQQKGEIVSIKPTGYVWKDGVWPNADFVLLRVTDITFEKAYDYAEEWIIKFQHLILGENELGWRIELTVDPAVISASNVGKDVLKAEMRDYLEGLGFTIESFTSNKVVFEIPKSDDLAKRKKEFADIYNVRFDSRRYYFTSAKVDYAQTQGGIITMTGAEVLAAVKDKLEE